MDAVIVAVVEDDDMYSAAYSVWGSAGRRHPLHGHNWERAPGSTQLICHHPQLDVHEVFVPVGVDPASDCRWLAPRMVVRDRSWSVRCAVHSLPGDRHVFYVHSHHMSRLEALAECQWRKKSAARLGGFDPATMDVWECRHETSPKVHTATFERVELPRPHEGEPHRWVEATERHEFYALKWRGQRLRKRKVRRGTVVLDLVGQRCVVCDGFKTDTVWIREGVGQMIGTFESEIWTA